MGQIAAAYPDLPAFSQALTLGDVQYKLRLTWRERLGAWYADLWTAAGVEVWLGQRVSTGWGLALGLSPVDKPDGIFLVRGPSEYARGDLGGSVQLVFYPTDELPARSASDLGITVTLV